METHIIKLANSISKSDVDKIKTKLKHLYDVKKIEVDIINNEVRLVLDELGCINSCKTILNNLGYKLKVEGKKIKNITKKIGLEGSIPSHSINKSKILELV